MKTLHIHPQIEPLEARIAPAFAPVLDLAALTGANGFRLDGLTAGDLAGYAVGGAGDVNGDGFGDFIVGAAFATANGQSFAGQSYVVFGKAGGFPAVFNPASLNGANGFRINGAAPGDIAGAAVSAAGDFNGDGYDDLIVGAPFSDAGGLNSSGTAYVIFGKAGSFAASLNLSALNGSNGFRIEGVLTPGSVGTSVASAGDVNGDGYDDVILGGSAASAAYVVFGRPGSPGPSLLLNALDGTNGFKLSGMVGDSLGASVSGAGDVNGDGYDDVIVGAANASGGAGRAYVVFGKKAGFAADLAAVALNGTNGFTIAGAVATDSLGFSVAGAGDVNGDGFSDLIIGANGAAHVVLGRTTFASTLTSGALNGSNGFSLTGGGVVLGLTVSAAGDINADGFDDFLIGSSAAAMGKGAAFVVLGKASFNASFPLASLDGANGFRLDGSDANGQAGSAISRAGDVNGDGFDDILVGALFAGQQAGKAYVVFGSNGGNFVTIGPDGKTATFTDVDGDRVTIRVSKGVLDAGDFVLTGANALGGATLRMVDFAGDTDLAGTNVTINAKPQIIGGVLRGDGLVNVGAIETGSENLGAVKIAGDLGRIQAPVVKSLIVNSLGLAGLGTQGGRDTSLTSVIGTLPALVVKTNVEGVTFAGAKIGSAKVGGDVRDSRFLVSQMIKSLAIGGDLRSSQIIGGGSPFGGNADAQIGTVQVKGDWVASSLAAGIGVGADGRYGTADDKVFNGGDAAILSRIAKVVIGGQALGTFGHGDSFAIEAQQIGSVRVGKTALPLGKVALDDFLLGSTGDFRVRELA